MKMKMFKIKRIKRLNDEIDEIDEMIKELESMLDDGNVEDFSIEISSHLSYEISKETADGFLESSKKLLEKKKRELDKI